MILLHDPPLLFLKPHKVAGSSFEIALSRFAGPEDIVTPFVGRGAPDEDIRRGLGFPGPQNYAAPPEEWHALPPGEVERARRQGRFPARFRNHTSAADARARLPAAVWERSCKVSIVRNPFDLAVSRYFWSAPEGESFEDFWQRRADLLAWNRDQYLIGDDVVIDVFVRFEAFAEGIAELEQRFPRLAGLGETFAGIRAKAGHRPPSATTAAMFAGAPAVTAIVERECRFEIERFGYSLER